ncbi:MAG: SDR family NAD-dependent epimerase/dehydratase, partial [Mesorhizobium sp.]
PDIGCALRELNWKPRIALRDGLAKTIAYFDDLISSGHAGSAAAE